MAEDPGGPARVLVLYERRSSCAATLAEAAAMAAEGASVTVLALARQDRSPARCVVYTGALNDGVREDAAKDLADAREMLGPTAEQVNFMTLVTGREESVETWAAGRFDLVLLPARRLHPRRHPAVRAFRRTGGTSVRVLR
jgi:hypothetical protein